MAGTDLFNEKEWEVILDLSHSWDGYKRIS